MKRSKPVTPIRPEALIHECGRCGIIHNGNRPGPGWSDHSHFGTICDACDESLRLSALTGTRVARAA